MDIIIGAGVSGIAYANFTHNKFKIYELENEPGGYCRTIKRNGFVWDYSGHFFHFRHEDLRKLVCKNIPAEQIVTTRKHTQIFYKGQYIDFPFQSNIHQLPKEELIDCLYDLFTADPAAKSETFKEFVYNDLGRSISEKFLVPYNEKLYATDLNNLDADAMGRFFPKADKESIIRNFKNSDNNSYNDTFAYPKGGAVEYINSLLYNLPKDAVTYNTKITAVDLEAKQATLSNGEKITYDNLISATPFPQLLDMCAIKYDKSIYTCNKIVVFNLGFDSESNDKNNSWIYFPCKELPFYRIGYYNNIIGSPQMSLYVEVGYSEDATIEDEESLLQKILDGLKKVGVIDNQKLVDHQMIVMNPAYVHINKRHLEDIKKQKELLKQYNVYSIGRYGSWTYCSIEDNIIEAQNLAQELNK